APTIPPPTIAMSKLMAQKYVKKEFVCCIHSSENEPKPLKAVSLIFLNAKTMKTPAILVLLCINFSSFLFSQNKTSEDAPYIEVDGYAEKEIIPNEIYIGIILRERMENKVKVTIEAQEKQLREALTTLSIPIANLSVADANADYVKVSWQKRDVLTKKEYLLKVGNATAVGKVFQELEKLKIQDGFIDHVSHSAIDSLRKQVRIEAIKNAKEKADYLLNAIGQSTGNALIVSETLKDVVLRQDISRMPAKALTKIPGVIVSDFGNSPPEIEFQKIKLSYSIYTKFAIK
ncbi:MAG: SIMPL domain-containing protein, partial [Flavobacteriia bacterium]|nr:SIMPL domain-containing protein [Flavobacteriia bacterium]